jgi:hypothetical protein
VLAHSTDEVPAQRISDRLPVQRTSGQFSTQAPVTGRFAARTSGTFDVPDVSELDVAEQTDPARTTSTFELAEQPNEPPALAGATFDLETEPHEQPTHTGATFDLEEPPDEHGKSDTFELAEQPHSRVSGSFAAVEPPVAEIPATRSSGTFEVAETPRSRISGTYAVAQPPPAVAETPRGFTTQPPTTGVFATRADRRTTNPPATHPAVELPPAPTRRPPSGTHAAVAAHPALDRPARRPTTPNPSIDPQPVARMPGAHPALDPPARRAPTPNPAIDPQPVARMPATQPPARPTPIPVRPTPMPVRPTPVPTPARTATLQGPAAPPPVAPVAPVAPAVPEITAAQHHDRGVALLDRDLPKAIAELRTAFQMSGDIDHEATLAWAVFCAAPNKESVAKNTKAVLAKAIYQSSDRAWLAHFYYGRMERMLGRDREALAQFKTVVEQMPRHAEALAEIRMLEARLGPRRM